MYFTGVRSYAVSRLSQFVPLTRRTIGAHWARPALVGRTLLAAPLNLSRVHAAPFHADTIRAQERRLDEHLAEWNAKLAALDAKFEMDRDADRANMAAFKLQMDDIVEIGASMATLRVNSQLMGILRATGFVKGARSRCARARSARTVHTVIGLVDHSLTLHLLESFLSNVRPELSEEEYRDLCNYDGEVSDSRSAAESLYSVIQSWGQCLDEDAEGTDATYALSSSALASLTRHERYLQHWRDEAGKHGMSAARFLSQVRVILKLTKFLQPPP